jgi:small subunit ribosomal protein S20
VAHSKSALKRWRQNEAHRERNRPVRTAARTAVRKAHGTIASGAADEGALAIAEAAAILDRAAKRKIIHKNAASRHKSRMMRQVARAGSPAAEPPKKARKTTTKAKGPAKPRATRTKSAAKG